MATTDIEHILPEETLKNIADINDGLGVMEKQLLKIVAASEQIDSDFGGLGNVKSIKEEVAAKQKAATVNAQLVTGTKMYVQVVEAETAAKKKLEAAQKSLTIAESAEAKEISSVTQKRNKLNYEIKQQVKAQESAIGSLNHLKAELALVRIEYDKLDANTRENTVQGKAQLLNIQRLTNELKRLEQQMGVHGRSVGDYAKGWNGLNNSVSQLAREMPAFANSFTTGIMAVSNNIPILIDEIDRLKLKNAELAASGEKTKPVWKSIGAALLSWQTAIIAGVTLLALYGKEIVAFFTGSSEATKKAEEATKRYKESLNEATKSANKNAMEEQARLEILNSVATDVTKSTTARNKAVREMIKLYPQYLDGYTQEAIKAGQAAAAIDKITQALIARANAQAAEKRLIVVGEKILDLEAERRKAIAAQSKAEIELDKIKKRGIENDEDGARLIQDYTNKRDMARRAVNNLTASIEEQRKVQEQYAKQAADTAGTSFEFSDFGAGPKEKNDKNLKDRSKEQFEAQAAELKQRMEVNKSIADDDKASYDTRIEALEKYFDLKRRLIIESAEYEKTVGNKSLAEIEAIELGKQVALKDLTQEALDSETKAAQDSLKIERDLAKEREKLQKENADRVIKNAELSVKIEEEAARKRIALIQKITDFGRQAADAAIAINRGQTERELEGLDRQDRENEISTEREIARIERSALSQEEKEERISEAEAKADIKRQQIEQARIEQDRRRANFEKQMTLAKIALSTFMAVAKELGSNGVAGIVTSGAVLAFLSGIAGAAGAIAIPAYAEGTDYHRGGLALLGDGGEPERIDLPSGQSFFSPATDTLMNLPAGTSVTPMSDIIEDSAGMLTPRLLNSIMLDSRGNTARMERMMAKKLDEVKEAINGKPTSNISFSRGFMYETVTTGNVKRTFLRKNLTD